MEVTNSAGITVKIFSIEYGLRSFENIDLIRVKSRHCNLLIMYDHLPILGDIEGSLEFVNKEEVTTFEKIKGYFMFKNNQFEFIVKE